jgi:DNA-binding transcriptional LysR family regulator
MAPEPCVYRAAALAALEKAGRPWRQMLTSPSHAGTIAAVRAGLGLTVLPRPMIPASLAAVPAGDVPALGHIHVSLLKHRSDDPAINSLEDFVLRKLVR